VLLQWTDSTQTGFIRWWMARNPEAKTREYIQPKREQKTTRRIIIIVNIIIQKGERTGRHQVQLTKIVPLP
jgi:hypothetical protein